MEELWKKNWRGRVVESLNLRRKDGWTRSFTVTFSIKYPSLERDGDAEFNLQFCSHKLNQHVCQFVHTELLSY